MAHTIQRDLLSALITTFEVRNTTLEKHHNSGSSYAPISNVANTFNDTDTDGQVVLVKILSKNVHAIPATIHMLIKTNTCCRTMAITVSCAMQRSAAIISEAQMWSRNARETTGLDAMKVKPRMTCKAEAGEDGSIAGY